MKLTKKELKHQVTALAVATLYIAIVAAIVVRILV